MKFYKILYSRSLSIDYRWMLIPPGVSASDLRILRDIYEEYDTYKENEVFRSLQPLYCINDLGFSSLFTCTSSGREDQFGREIYALEGLLIPPKYRRHFWFILPWLLVNSNKALNVWEGLDAQEADKLKNSTSPVMTLDIFAHRFQLGELESDVARSVDPKVYSQKSIQEIEYSRAGLDKLIRIVWSPFVPLLDFAFGASPKIASMRQWNIVAYAVQPRTHGVYSTKSNISVRGVVNSDVQRKHIPKRYDVLYVEWTRRGVFVHGKRSVVDEVEDEFFPKIQSLCPKAQVGYSLSSLPLPHNQWQKMELIRFHRLDGKDEHIGQWLVNKLVKGGKWEQFYPGYGGKYQGVWLRRSRKDTAPNHAFTRPAFGGK